MDVTLHQLRLLRQVQLLGTISAAAQAVRCTPSAASQQLATLEGLVGIPLLSKVGRSVQLTPAGERLAARATTMLTELELAQGELERAHHDASGSLHISILESLTPTILPQILVDLRHRHPALVIHTYQLESVALQRLRAGELDGAFLIDYPNALSQPDPSIHRQRLCRDWFKIAVRADDSLGGDKAALSTLAGRPMIAPPGHTSCGQCVIRACRSAGFEPRMVHQLEDYPSMLNLILAGVGVALIPDLGLLRVPDGIRIIELERPFYRLVEFACRHAAVERPAIQAVLGSLDRIARQAGLDR